MDNKAQVSFDYLLTVAFVLAFSIAVVAIISVLTQIANGAVARVAELRENTIASVIQ